MGATHMQKIASHVELERPGVTLLEQSAKNRGSARTVFGVGKARQHGPTRGEIYWSPIVGIGQCVVEQLEALIEVGHAGNYALENQSGQGVRDGGGGDLRHETI